MAHLSGMHVRFSSAASFATKDAKLSIKRSTAGLNELEPIAIPTLPSPAWRNA